MKDQETIALLEQQLGIPAKYGSWWMSHALLKKIWQDKKRPQVIRPTTYDLRELPFNDAARDIIWRRDLEPYMIGRTVHLFDKNWAYGAGCRTANMGIGDPEHLSDGDETYIPAGLPGIYRVTFKRNLSHFDDCLFPPVIENDQEWVTNDILVYALKHAYQVRIHEAWVFTDYKKILDEWAHTIWEARQALKGTPAYAEMKQIALVGVGSFATNKETCESFEEIHPNWLADAKGQARVTILANIDKAGAPVCIKTDGLYYVTADPNWRTAVPNLNLTPGQLGAYKHEMSVTLTQEMYERSIGMNPSELSSMFKEAAGVK